MIPNSNKPTFLDRGTIIALAIVAVAYWGWMQYMRSKHAVDSTPAVVTEPLAQNAALGDKAAVKPEATPVNGANAASAPTASHEESFVDYAKENFSFQISSQGMGLRNIDLKGYKTRDDKPIVLGEVPSAYPFSTLLVGATEPLDFKIESTGDGQFRGVAKSGDLTIEKTMIVNATNYSIDTEIKVTGAGLRGISTLISDQQMEAPKRGFLSGSSYDFQSWYLLHEATSVRRETLHREKGLEAAEKNVSAVGLSSHYFTLALVDRSPLLPTFESHIAANAAIASGRLVYTPVGNVDSFAVKYTAYAGPKSFSILSSVDSNLEKVVDYGMFAIIAKPILWLLKLLNTFFANWGWSIIVLTLIVRFIVLPFNVYSYKSMKVMQVIQPEMNRIRERYKDKPADQRLQMNQEIMEIMKKNKANPLGGCLPMLLQLPVFFALYQVLGQSIELYRAPFILWIHDLSAHDPFYVLPVAMGLTMFVQQKITPTTMDPQQAKIMMWVPLIFSFFMLSLPSGLTLYIFVSTLFGIVQQYIFMRDRTKSQAIKAAKA
jgi:YidC/Oxa1 family membrane protein insertase